jgi:hypothetical protein
MDKMDISKEKNIMREIHSLFQTANKLYDFLPNETKETLLEFNDEYYTLEHCIRRGLSASEDFCNAIR